MGDEDPETEGQENQNNSQEQTSTPTLSDMFVGTLTNSLTQMAVANPVLSIPILMNTTDEGLVMQQQAITGLSEAPGFLAGGFADIVHGLGTSAYNLYEFGAWTNPFHRFGRADSYTSTWTEATRTTIGDPIIAASPARGVRFQTTREFAEEFLNSEAPNGQTQLQAWTNRIYDSIRWNAQGEPIFARGDLGQNQRVVFRASERYNARTLDRNDDRLPDSSPTVRSENEIYFQTVEAEWMRTEYDGWKQNWQRENGIQGGGIWDYNYSTDGGETWKAVNGTIGAAVILGNVCDPTIFAGGVGIIGKARLIRVGAELVEQGGKAAFVVGSVAVGAEVVSMFAAEAPKVTELSRLLTQPGNSFATRRGIFDLEWQLNENNENLVNAAISSGATGRMAPRYIEADGVFDEDTKQAFLNAANMVRYSEYYRMMGEEGDVESLRAYESISLIQDRFYALAEWYVNDPEGFNPTENDMLVMQFYMYGNGFSGFANEGVELGLAGKEYTLSYLDEHFERNPSARTALLGAGVRREYSVAAEGTEGGGPEREVPNEGFIMSREQRAAQAQDRAGFREEVERADEVELERMQRMATVPYL